MYRFVWKIKLNKPEEKQAFIEHWRTGSKIINEYPGALGVHLHSVRNEPESLFVVAEWQSQEARDAMIADFEKGESDFAKRWNLLPRNESFGEVTLFFGTEIEAIMPSTSSL